jgi:hypothetical protein
MNFVVINEFCWRTVWISLFKSIHCMTDVVLISQSLFLYSWLLHKIMQSLTQNILYKKHLFFNVYENVLHLMKYLRKFHTILRVKNETLQSWHSCSLQIFYQSLYTCGLYYKHITIVIDAPK